MILNAVNVQYECAWDDRFFDKRMPRTEVHYLFESHTMSWVAGVANSDASEEKRGERRTVKINE